ncbi:MAG: 1-deoxy-D-xylulose-5-phosphate reductoisomerase [Spirochaetales bacterium]|nr:1-deoxy-D-xylulose-5-phosphate reductoisomerase [Spirochaetales bacterium]
MNRKKIIILGCTGSIGRNTVTVLKRNRDYFKVVGISAHTDESGLIKFAESFDVKNMCLTGRQPSYSQINFQGESGLIEMIRDTEADIVLNGISGSAGLSSSIAALESGKDLALANKETVVMTGSLIMNLAKQHGKEILPVDSEHSAIWQILKGREKKSISEIILTASGGAFRNRPIEALKNVTVEAALAHPTWNMGPKITIDSATMANKGLEIIEAHFLFDIPAENIKIVVHPKSYVHAFIRTIDGCLYTQLSMPDMAIPIQNALSWPDILPADFASLSLSDIMLEFKALDREKYPIVDTAYEALRLKGAYPLVFNAANEIAVSSFIEGRISFLDIAEVTRDAVEKDWPRRLETFEQVFALDAEARMVSLKLIDKYGSNK